MKITEFWWHPLTLTIVCAVVAIISVFDAVYSFQNSRIWEGIFWTFFGILLALWGWGVYYYRLGRGAQKIEEEERRRKEEFTRIYSSRKDS